MVAGGHGVNRACRACGLVGLVVGGRGSVCVRLVLLVPVVALRVRPAVYLAHARVGYLCSGRRGGQGEALWLAAGGLDSGATAGVGGASFVLELPVKVLSLLFIQIDELLPFLGVACVIILLPLDQVSPFANVVTYGHFLGASAGVLHRLACLLNAVRANLCAASRTVYLWLSARSAGHDDGAAAEGAARGDMVHVATAHISEKSVECRHLRHERHHRVSVTRAHYGKRTLTSEHAERIREQGVHHIVHLAHLTHVRPEKRIIFHVAHQRSEERHLC